MNSTVSTLFHEVERLDNRSLDAFIDNVISLRVRRDTSSKQKEEAELLEKINRSLSLKQVERFRELNQKRIEENIAESELVELTVLLEKTEKLNVNRLKYLSLLARLRNISVRDLMNQLGISNPTNG
ncbi:STAS/SEC14 domain-containing protein [Arcicella aurantiaca]|nr:STAS/SEC14 domain-containing protein [Arcicella aurantiaca]